MNLLSVELRRLVSRRLFIVLSVLVIAGLTLAGVLTFVHSDDSPRAVAAAEAERKVAVQQCVTDHERHGDGGAAREAAALCEEEVWVEDPRFLYSDVRWIVMTMGLPMIMLAWLLGATFMGAEWSNRTLTSLLTWEPRRLRVLAAKASALAVVSFAWVFSLQAYLAGVLYPAAHFRGDTTGLDASFWIDLAGDAARVGLIGVLAGLMGLALATVGKNTAAALGVGFVHLALVEGLIRAFRPQWMEWLIGDNLALFLIGPEDAANLGHSQGAAGLLLAAYTCTLLALAAAVFRRREMS